MLAYELSNLLNSQAVHTPMRTPSPDMDKQAFLQLLVKQLATQDPLDPMGNDEFVGQLALFSSVEQAINLNDSFNQFMAFQQLTQASTLLDRQVICLVQTQEGLLPIQGTVEQVLMINGKPYLKLSDGSEVELSTVVSVQPASDDDGGDS